MQKTHSISHLGNQLFRWRRLVYFIPVLLLVIHRKSLFYPFGTELMDEIFEFMSLGLACLGLAVRFWASGSSGRSILSKEGRQLVHLKTDGIFSLVRNPYGVGEFLIVTGLSIPLFYLSWTALSVAVFVAVYLPIALAREEILRQSFPEDYGDYAKKIRLFIPTFRHWERSKSHFSWLLALRKEGSVLVTVGFLFYFIEQFRDLAIRGTWDPSLWWILAMAPFLFIFILSRSFDPELEKLPDLPHLPD